MQSSLFGYTENASARNRRNVTLDEFLSDSSSLEETCALIRDAIRLRALRDGFLTLGRAVPMAVEIEAAELMDRERVLFKNVALSTAEPGFAAGQPG